jgi:hypothetical protein
MKWTLYGTKSCSMKPSVEYHSLLFLFVDTSLCKFTLAGINKKKLEGVLFIRFQKEVQWPPRALILLGDKVCWLLFKYQEVFRRQFETSIPGFMVAISRLYSMTLCFLHIRLSRFSKWTAMISKSRN